MKEIFLFLVIVTPTLVLAAGPAGRDFLRYTDDKGTIHFIDDISKVPAEFRKNSVPINASRYANPKNRACNYTIQGGADKVTITAKLNEGTPVRFLIDPKAKQSLITPKVAESLGFNVTDPNLRKIEISTKGEKVSVPLAKLDRVDLQGCQAQNVYFAITDYAETPDYSGVLGEDFFKKFRATIDLAGGKIVLEDLKK